jgi:hypothetical protein
MHGPVPIRILESEYKKCVEAAHMTIISDTAIAEIFNV